MLALVGLAGIAVGVALGALGAGGSILAVPALTYLVGQDADAATAGSLIVVGISSVAALVPHLRARRVRVAKGVVFGLLGVAGAYLGSRLSVGVPDEVLMTLFAGLLVAVGVLMARRTWVERRGGKGTGVQAQEPPPAVRLRPFACDCRRLLLVLSAAAVVGLLTGFFGVGGGFVVVPALVLALGLSMPVAVGTSLVVIVVNSVTALASRAGAGVEVDWSVIAVFASGAVAGSLVGGRLVTRVPAHRLTGVLAAVLLLVAAYTAVRSIPELVGAW